ncbi:hypothetical protein GCM10010124_23160 [Pilimelia terevasa]|uniref:Ricin B lectin domain-containing protein n=1 Tax=Pilimelia terevasa TaxID=53372 RepID=A0A8J3BKX9_9ACTN|nr:RICIN domain-containing protein [Pilimelia terevasa]GGK29813.1 hypothetical protein GCM10010124_23160 [Pilimelia terevasa]
MQTAIATMAVLLAAAALPGSAAGPTTPAERTTSGPHAPALEALLGGRVGVPTGPLPTSTPPTTSPTDGADMTGFVCDGNGGARAEVLYVREATMPDRHAAMQPVLQAWLVNADAAFNDGAARQGQSRHLRFLTEKVGDGCRAVVKHVVVPEGSLKDFEQSVDAVRALDYDQNDRKYLMITESTEVCGIAGYSSDDSPGPGNASNTGTSYLRVDATAGCLGANAIAHEMGHALGAVQDSAPHADDGHCTQALDMMCHDDKTPTPDCPEWDSKRLPDCAGDDYFNVAPPAGSYLATHWNLARSRYFYASDAPSNADYPRPGFTYLVTNAASGAALDIDPADGSTNDPRRYLSAAPADSASATQKWLVGYDLGIQLMNNDSLLCLDSANRSQKPGTRSYQVECAGEDGQRWAYLPHTDGSFSILNWLTGLALTQGRPDKPLVKQQVYSGAANQRWHVKRIADPAPLGSSGTYHLAALSSRDAVSAPAPSLPGTVVTHSPRSNATSQQWRLTARGQYWQLKLSSTALCVSNNRATTVGGELTLRPCAITGTDQQWSLTRIADGRYQLVNRLSGLAMAMTDGDLSALQQQPADAKNRAQVFALTLD